MVQSSGLKNVLTRFKRGSAAKTPGNTNKLGSPSKQDAGPSPSKRLFAFSPAKAPTSSRKCIKECEAAAADLIPAAHLSMAVNSPIDAGGDDSNIRVVVRVRPRNDREASMGGAICVQPQDGNSLRLVAPAEPHSFAFDHVANETSSQKDMFNVAGRPIVDNCLRGFNSCLFAYGQTGSGKTHSMLGGEQMAGDAAVAGDERRGLIQRIFEQIFAAAETQASTGVQTKITCSFLEIYNETISDLLSPGAVAGLPLREDSRRNGGVFVEGLSEESVLNVADVAYLLERGVSNRRIGATLMNERSSRSHSVFTATVERRTPGVDGAPDTVLRSRLHLVDLAGSERQKTTGAAGDRLKEASGINKSLSTLGLVIMSLVDQQQGRQRHIPYRDSKLTTLLRDSLGGNAKTVMVACISPAAINSAETLSTLRFADGAKRIKNKAIVNEDAEGDAESLRREVRRLKEELALMGRAAGAHNAHNDDEATDPVTPRRAVPAAGELPPMTTGGGHGGEGVRRALVGALRREEAAAVQVSTLQEELEGMRALVAARDADLQRTQMMLKLKESRLSRAAPSSDETITALNSEIELLKAKLDSHPEVKRFAVENLHLSHEVTRLQSALDRHELAALGADVASLRREILGLTETTEVAEEECARARAEAEAAKASLENESHALKEALLKLKEGQEVAPALQQRVADLELENDELRLEAVNTKALKEEAERLCTHASGLEVECESLKAALDSKTKEAAETEAVYKGSVEELATAWEELEKLEAVNTSLEAAVAGAAAAAAVYQEEHEAALSHASSSLEESLCTISELKTDIKASKADAEELRAAAAAVTQERDGLIEKVKAKDQELEEAHAAFTKISIDLETERTKLQETEAQAEELKNKLAASTTRAEKAEAAAIEAENQSKELFTSLKATKNELQGIETQLATSNAEIALLQEAAVKSAEELSSSKSALNTAMTEAATLRMDLNIATKRHQEEIEQLQEELFTVQGSKDELEYLFSDKSASLSEATEQLTSLRAMLKSTKAAEEASGAKVVELTAELRAVKEAQEVVDHEQEVLEKKVVLLEQEVKEAAAEVSALRCGPLEKEQQLLLARAELADAKSLYEKTRLELATLSAGMRKKDEEVARVRAEMAMEVNDAAHQVQELLAAQERAEAAERRAAELAERCGKRPSLGSAQ
jgi:kinesin family protein 15